MGNLPNPLPPAGVPVLDGNDLTLPWRRALQALGNQAGGGVTPAELAVVAAEAAAAESAASHAEATAEAALAAASSAGEPDLVPLALLDGAFNVSAAYRLVHARTFSYTGDATGGPTSFNGSANVSTALTLAASGVTAATYGDATHVAQVTFDAKGRATAAANVAITHPVPSVTFGTGVPAGTPAEGALYFDTTGTPYAGYVGRSSAWHAFT